MSDTPPDVAARYRALLLERSPAERMIMACAMFDSARHLMIAGIRADEPGISETELRVRVFERTYGRDFSGEARDRIIARIRRDARRVEQPGAPPKPLRHRSVRRTRPATRSR